MGEPARFGNYEVQRRDDGSAVELGRGAMGITYQARDSRNGALVALKVINADRLGREMSRRRFIREARVAGEVDHPNVARVFQQGEQDGVCFYAMEFIDGETLLALLQREGALPTPRALEIAAQVADALAAAAARGLVHRDIKPSNIMLERSTGATKLIDFGLAKHAADEAGDADASTLTHAGFLGTPHFASPEQLEERELDPRSDIYSLGATLYFALTGRTPFTGSLAQVMSQHLRAAPSRDGLVGQPEAVANLVERMMAKDPADRPASPAVLRQEIRRCLEEIAAAKTGVAGGAPVLDGEGETMTDVVEESEMQTLVPDSILAGRFALLEEYAPGEFGRTFRARNLETGEIVAVLVLDRDLLPTSDAYTRLENAVNALQAIRHPAVVPVHSIEWAPPHCWISREWIEGTPLLELLRSGMSVGDAWHLLTALAGGLDAVQRAGAPCPTLAARWITLVPGPGGGLLPKFNALNLSHVAPRLPAEVRFHRRTGADFVMALAGLAYEMFGGSLAGNSDQTFVPVRDLPAETNLLLRRALHSEHGFHSPGAFAAALGDTLGDRSDASAGISAQPLPSRN
jgi:serine/threonine protein kinase